MLVARGRTAAYRLALLALQAWWAVRRPRSSGVRCVVRRGDAFVLVRHAYGDRRWMLPGGRMRAGEDPTATAAREMLQELGVECERWQVVGRVGARKGYRRRSRADSFRRHSTYYIRGEARAAAIAPRAGELTDAAWFAVGALPHDRSESVDLAAASGWLPAGEVRRADSDSG